MANGKAVAVPSYGQLIEKYPRLVKEDPAALARAIYNRDFSEDIDRGDFDMQFYSDFTLDAPSGVVPATPPGKHPYEQYIEEHPEHASDKLFELTESIRRDKGISADDMYGELEKEFNMPIQAYLAQFDTSYDWKKAGTAIKDGLIKFNDHLNIGLYSSIAELEGVAAKALGWAVPNGWALSDEWWNEGKARMVSAVTDRMVDIERRGGDHGILGFLDKAIGEGLGATPTGIAEFKAGTVYAGIKAGLKALDDPDKNIAWAIVKAGYERYFLGKLFHRMIPLKKHIKAPAMGVTFALQGLINGERDPEKLGEAMTMGMVFGLTERNTGTIGATEGIKLATDYWKDAKSQIEVRKQLLDAAKNLDEKAVLDIVDHAGFLNVEEKAGQFQHRTSDILDQIHADFETQRTTPKAPTVKDAVNELHKIANERAGEVAGTNITEADKFRWAVREARKRGLDVTKADLTDILSPKLIAEMVPQEVADAEDAKLKKQDITLHIREDEFNPVQDFERDAPDFDGEDSMAIETLNELVLTGEATDFLLEKKKEGAEESDFNITGSIERMPSGNKGIYVEGMYNNSEKAQSGMVKTLFRIANMYQLEVRQTPSFSSFGLKPWHPDFKSHHLLGQQNLVKRYLSLGFEPILKGEDITDPQGAAFYDGVTEGINTRLQEIRMVKEAQDAGIPLDDVPTDAKTIARLKRMKETYAEIEKESPGKLKLNADLIEKGKTYDLNEIAKNWPYLFEGEMSRKPSGSPAKEALEVLTEKVAVDADPIDRVREEELNRNHKLQKQTEALLKYIGDMKAVREQTGGAEPIYVTDETDTDAYVDPFLGYEEYRYTIESAGKFDPEGEQAKRGNPETFKETSRGALSEADKELHRVATDQASIFKIYEKQLADMEPGWQNLAKKLVAGRIITGRLATLLNEMAIDLKTKRDQGIDDYFGKIKFMDRLETFNNIDHMVSGLRTNVGRALNASKIYVKEGWVRMDEVDPETFARSKQGQNLAKKMAERPDMKDIDSYIDRWTKKQTRSGAMHLAKEKDNSPMMDALVEFRLSNMLGSINTQLVNTSTAVAHALWQAMVEAPIAYTYGKVQYGKDSPITMHEVGIRNYHTVVGLLNEFIAKPLWVVGKHAPGEITKVLSGPVKYMKEAPGRLEEAIDKNRPDEFDRTEVEKLADKAINSEKLKKNKAIAKAGKITGKIADAFLPVKKGTSEDLIWGGVDFIGQLQRLQGFGWMSLSDNAVKRVAIRTEVASLAYRNAVEEGLPPAKRRAYVDKMLDFTERYRKGEDLSFMSEEQFKFVGDLLSSGIQRGRYTTFMDQLTSSRANALAHAFSGPGGKLTVVPFFVTPANLLKWNFERLPVPGYDPEATIPLTLKGLGDIRAMSQSKDPAVKAEAFSRVAGGGILLAVTSALVFGTNNTVTPDFIPEDRQKLVENLRILPSGIKVGDKLYQYNRSDPFGFYLSVVSQMNYMYHIAMTKDLGPNVDENEIMERLKDVGLGLVMVGGDQVLQRSYFQGISEFSEAMTDPERNFERFINNWIGSFVPASGLAKSITERIDPKLREVDGLLQTIQKAYFPMGLDVAHLDALPEQKDVFGKPVTDYGRMMGLMTMEPERESKVRNWMALLGVDMKTTRNLLPGIPAEKKDINAIKEIVAKNELEEQMNEFIASSDKFDPDAPESSRNPTEQRMLLQKFLRAGWAQATGEYIQTHPKYAKALEDYYQSIRDQGALLGPEDATLERLILGGRGIKRLR